MLVKLLFKIRARTGVGLTEALEQSKVLSVSKTADFMDLGGWVPVLQLVDAQCMYYVYRNVSIHALFTVDRSKVVFSITEMSIVISAEQFYSHYPLLRFPQTIL
jgi:hypothetical protein